MSSRSSSSRQQKRGSTSTSKSRRTTTDTTATKTTKRSGPYDRNFEQNHKDTGVYRYGHELGDGSVPPLPPEWEGFNRSMAQDRPSLSPSRFSDGGRQEFVRKDAKAQNETDVTGKVIPAMLRAMGASEEEAQGNILFTNMEPLTTRNTQAKPDYYWGAQPEQLDQGVREELSKLIVPQPGRHIVPNFFLEAKGPDGSSAVAVRQACHDGAIGARAMRSLQSYGQEEAVYDNNISAVSSTYHAGTLKMYAHSVAQPGGLGTRPEYYMHQLDSYSMTGNKKNFLEGATAFKNAMDMTAEYRNAAIARANEIAQTSQTVGTPDEDEAEDEDEGEDQEESETSVEKEEYRPLPQKRSKPQPAHRKKRTTGGMER